MKFKKILFVFTFFCIFLSVKIDSRATGIVDGSDGVTDGSTGNIIGDIVEDVVEGTDDDSESTNTDEDYFDDVGSDDVEKDDAGHIINGYARSAVEASEFLTTYYYRRVTNDNGSYCYWVDLGTIYKLVSVNGKSIVECQEYNINDGVRSDITVSSYEIGETLDGCSVVGGRLYFETNIPIFEYGDDESIAKYVENGDYSGAENAEDVDKEIAANDESVEAPQGFKVSGGYATGLSSAYHFAHDFVANWTQTVDTSEYVYDVQAKCTISIVSNSGSTVLTGESYSSDWIDYGTKNYSGSTSVTHSISKDNLNDKLLESALANAMDKSGKKLTYKGYLISKLKIRVRNRVGNKCSDWYVATVDYDSSSTTGTVEDDDENVIEDDGDIADENDDSATTGESIESNISAILSYIRSGFGLLGDTGIIALMSQCFLYLPASIWTMLKFLIAMTVTMSIIGLIKKFVF